MEYQRLLVRFAIILIVFISAAGQPIPKWLMAWSESMDRLTGARRSTTTTVKPFQLKPINRNLPKGTRETAAEFQFYRMTTRVHSSEVFNELYADVKELIETGQGQGYLQHPQLKYSYRRAVMKKLHFPFEFYGYPTPNVVIATGGFISCGDRPRSWLSATQYIAPLMANFNTTEHEKSTVSYVDTGDRLIVEWRDVILRDQATFGPFTFQAVLWRNGSIWFLYKNIPVDVRYISNTTHPRQVGLSDAYLNTKEESWFFSKKQVIYEYHRIEVPFEHVQNNAVVIFDPLKTCFSYRTCSDCMKSTLTTFNCTWCWVYDGVNSTGFCSGTEGRHRMHDEFKNGECGKPDSPAWHCAPPVITTTSTVPPEGTTTDADEKRSNTGLKKATVTLPS